MFISAATGSDQKHGMSETNKLYVKKHQKWLF